VPAATEAVATPAQMQLVPLTGSLANDTKCPTGSRCNGTGVIVKCNWNGTWRNSKAWFAERNDGLTSPRGVVVFLSGGNGKGYTWGTGDASPQMFTDLKNHNIHVVQARWNGNWMLGPSGDVSAGFAHLGCRPYGLITWVYQKVYQQEFHLDQVPHPQFECGFCVAGTSYGTEQVAYPMTVYGVAGDGTGANAFVDAAFFAAGPTLAGMVKACTKVYGYYYDKTHRADVDKSYGDTSGTGPCVSYSTLAIWRQTRWPNDGVDTGAIYTAFPNTRVHIILGKLDKESVWKHARDWEGQLENASPGDCDFQTSGGDVIGEPCYEILIPGMGHAIRDSLAGLANLTRGVIWPETL